MDRSVSFSPQPRSPGDPVPYATAIEALATTLQSPRALRIARADDPATRRQIETLCSLQNAERRLAELRAAHLLTSDTIQDRGMTQFAAKNAGACPWGIVWCR